MTVTRLGVRGPSLEHFVPDCCCAFCNAPVSPQPLWHVLLEGVFVALRASAPRSEIFAVPETHSANQQRYTLRPRCDLSAINSDHRTALMREVAVEPIIAIRHWVDGVVSEVSPRAVLAIPQARVKARVPAHDLLHDVRLRVVKQTHLMLVLVPAFVLVRIRACVTPALEALVLLVPGVRRLERFVLLPQQLVPHHLDRLDFEVWKAFANPPLHLGPQVRLLLSGDLDRVRSLAIRHGTPVLRVVRFLLGSQLLLQLSSLLCVLLLLLLKHLYCVLFDFLFFSSKPRQHLLMLRLLPREHFLVRCLLPRLFLCELSRSLPLSRRSFSLRLWRRSRWPSAWKTARIVLWRRWRACVLRRRGRPVLSYLRDVSVLETQPF